MTVSRVGRIASVLMAAALLFAGSSILRAAQAAKLDLTGAWIFTVESANGTATPSVTFKQDGEKLTGHYSSATLGEADLTGSLKGSALTITFPTEVAGEVTYKGTVENNNAIKGTLVIAAQEAGTFTAKRK
jgi:hypothetical protein